MVNKIEKSIPFCKSNQNSFPNWNAVLCNLYILFVIYVLFVRTVCMWILQVATKTDLGDVLERVSRCKKAAVNLERKVLYLVTVLCVYDTA